MQLLNRVRQFVREHDLVRPGTRVLAAVSGGSDSVALVHLLRELDLAGEMTLVGVAHLNHQLRATAERDERFSIGLAETLGVTAFLERADVSARAEAERRSLEDAAHAARYEFFERARLQAAADVVAVGHTRDDQAETFLLRLLRGAGPHGLASMYPRRGRIIRPLLVCRRRELRDYLAARQTAYVEDESNRDVAIARNRVRAELVPLLEARFNPAIVDVLADEATLARETWLWLKQAADALAERVTLPSASPAAPIGGRHIDVAALNRAPRALARVVLWRAMTEVGGGRPIAFAHVEAALRLTQGDQDAALDVPGQRVERVGPRLVLTPRPPGAVGRWSPNPAKRLNPVNPVNPVNRVNPVNPANPANPVNPANAVNLFRYPLSIPGEVRLTEAGYVISAEPLGPQEIAPARPATVGNGPEALVRHDLCREALAVRNRRPGDRFRPVGLGGKKKLQDFFVDRKVARERRDAVPLVVDQSDRIVWVAGYGIDEAFRITDPAQGMLLLTMKLSGGPV